MRGKKITKKKQEAKKPEAKPIPIQKSAVALWPLYLSVGIIGFLVLASIIVMTGQSCSAPSDNAANYASQNANTQTPARQERAYTFLGNSSDNYDGTAISKLLYVKDGDVWLAQSLTSRIKLIDANIVTRAEFSSDGKYIAYELSEPQLIDTEVAGSPKTASIVKRSLHLADAMGQNGTILAESIAQWGWIPGGSDVWFETSSIREETEWGIFPDGKYSIMNVQSKATEEFINDPDARIVNSAWDASGKKFVYAFFKGDEQQVRVYNRDTKETKSVFRIPEVASVKAGVYASPILQWNADASAVFVSFTYTGDVSENKGEFGEAYKPNDAYLLKITLANGKAELVHEASSDDMRPESYPKLSISNDGSTAIFVKPTETDSGSQSQDTFSLIAYDLAGKTEKTLVDSFIPGIVDEPLPTAYAGDGTYPLFAYENGTYSVLLVDMKTAETKKLLMLTVDNPSVTTVLIRNVALNAAGVVTFTIAEQPNGGIAQTEDAYVLHKTSDENQSWLFTKLADFVADIAIQ